VFGLWPNLSSRRLDATTIDWHNKFMPDDTFKEFVLDQLGALPELRAGVTLMSPKICFEPVGGRYTLAASL